MALLGVPLQAQGISPDVTTQLVPNLDFQEMEYGYVHGDLDPTMAVLADGTLYVVADPFSLGVMTPVDPNLTGVTSICLLEGAEVYDPWEFVYSDGAGVHALTGDNETWSFSPPATLLGASWANSTDMRRVPYGSIGRHIFAISASGTVLQSVVEDSSGAWVPAFSVTTLSTIRDYAFVDWDQDLGTPAHVAVLTDNWLLVYAYGATSPTWGTRTSSTASTDDQLASLRTKLVWTTYDAQSDPVLRVVSNAGFEADVPLSLPVVSGDPAQDLAVSGLTTGDLDGDTLQDVILGDYASHRIGCLLNSGGSQTFSTAVEGNDYELVHVDEVNPYVSGTWNDCEPLAIDIDEDATDDLFFLSDWFGRLTLHATSLWALGPVGGVNTDPRLAGPESAGDGVDPFDPDYFDCVDGSGDENACGGNIVWLTLKMQYAQSQAYDYVEVLVLVKPDGQNYLQSGSESHDLYTLEDSSGLPPTQDVPHRIGVAIQQPYYTWPAGTNYFIRYRLVNINNTTEKRVTQATSWKTAGVRFDYVGLLDPSTADSHFTLLINSSYPGSPFYDLDYDEGGPGSGGPSNGGFKLGRVYVRVTTPPPLPGQQITPGGIDNIYPSQGFY